MSRRTSSGNRFEGLFLQASDSSESDDDLAQYAPATPGPGQSRVQASQMRGNRDSFESLLSGVRPRPSQTTPSTASTGLSGSPYGMDLPEGRDMSLGSIEEPSVLEFAWDHYRAEPNPFGDDGADGGLDALQGMFDPSVGRSTRLQMPWDEPSPNIDEDMKILRGIGFNIDYPNGKLGEGYYGQVFKGHYGVDATDVQTNRFAVKLTENGEKDDEETLERREGFETEKYILTSASHRNIVSIRMIINMGRIRSFPYKEDPNKTFLSPDRHYMVMDFAHGGDLDTWLDKQGRSKIPASVRLDLIRGLFFGLLYLHLSNIAHGDAHTGNVLIFYDENEDPVAKWADFGLGFVGSDKRYRFLRPKGDNNLMFSLDIEGMFRVVGSVMNQRNQRNETPEEKELMEDVLEMRGWLKSMKPLIQIQRQFPRLLDFTFDEKHFL